MATLYFLVLPCPIPLLVPSSVEEHCLSSVLFGKSDSVTISSRPSQENPVLPNPVVPLPHLDYCLHELVGQQK